MAEIKYDELKQYRQRFGALKQERSTWLAHWKELSEYLAPRQGRGLAGGRDIQNDGARKHNKIYDNTGSRALNTLSAGLMSGLTSPARPWFRLSTGDEALNKDPAVKQWLNDVTDLMLSIFQKSNTYRALHQMYKELSCFGTAASIIMPDFNKVIHHFPLTIGEYCIATDYQGRVQTLYRELDITVGQMVQEFGIDNVSGVVKSAFDAGRLDQWIPIVHLIEPRAERDPKMLDNKNMPFRDVYYEASETSGKVLREGGFKRFPAIVPRWDVCSGDVYGNSPGMEALGDIKQLQHQQLRKAQCIDYQTKPPLQAPSSMKNDFVDMLPGGLTFVDQQQGIRPSFESTLRLDHLSQDIIDVRHRIDASFYADLFLMLANDGGTGRMTATEVAERHEEKMLMLGPVLERLQDELLDPLIEITFERMIEADIVPPPPEAMQGMPLNVDLVSMLAQAQRSIATNGTDRFIGAMANIAQLKPDVLDKFDGDAWVDIYSDQLGVNPDLINSNDVVAQTRQARAQAQQQAAEMAQQQMTAEMGKTLGQVPTSGDNAAASLMGSM